MVECGEVESVVWFVVEWSSFTPLCTRAITQNPSASTWAQKHLAVFLIVLRPVWTKHISFSRSIFCALHFSPMSKCGFVFKEGAQIYSWKKRFLSIEPDQGKISYYVKDDRKTKKGEIIIKTIKAVKRYSDYKSRKFVFGVITTTGRTFFIQATDDESVDSWMKAIEGVAGLRAPSLPMQPSHTPPPKPTTPINHSYPPPLASGSGFGSNSGYSGSGAGQSQYQVPEKVLVDDFETLKVIGRGGFGRVLLVRKKDNKKVCSKDTPPKLSQPLVMFTFFHCFSPLTNSVHCLY